MINSSLFKNEQVKKQMNAYFNQNELLKILYLFLLKVIKIEMSAIFFGEYKNIKKLGEGSFAKVYLVEDQQANRFALKLISKQLIKSHSKVGDYLNSEIEGYQNITSQNCIALQKVLEDTKFIGLLLEYCEGGNLLQVQSREINQVFSFQRAVSIMVQVIKGICDIHSQGYVHRDIKHQNILMKTQNGQQIIKIADFGFCKKNNEQTGSFLGTIELMSPEIFEPDENEGDGYGYEVDMWSFGVVFYYMLNCQFPFHINNQNQTSLKKKNELIKLSKDFSYKKSVENSKKQIMENCTPQVQNLFKGIFESNIQKRVTFDDVKSSPMFKSYFPLVLQRSLIFQRTQNERKNQLKKAFKKIGNIGEQQEKNVQQANMDKFLKKIKEVRAEMRVIDKQMEKALETVKFATPQTIQEVFQYFKQRQQDYKQELGQLCQKVSQLIDNEEKFYEQLSNLPKKKIQVLE